MAHTKPWIEFPSYKLYLFTFTNCSEHTLVIVNPPDIIYVGGENDPVSLRK